MPTGTVQLLRGTTVLASGTLSYGAVTLATTLQRGSHEVRAVYSGDARYLGVEQNLTLDVLPNQRFVIEARGLTTAVHVAFVLPDDTNLASPKLYRRTGGGAWQWLSGWSTQNGIDAQSLTRGVVYEYRLDASLTSGTPISSHVDTAMLFTDDTPRMPASRRSPSTRRSRARRSSARRTSLDCAPRLPRRANSCERHRRALITSRGR